jgi:hypothetical protein
VLLMAKLVTLCFLLTQWRNLPRPFLPFIPIFDRIGSPAAVQKVLKATFLVPATLLLCNRYVRPCCVVLGALVGFSVLSSRTYFGNNRTFTACLLFLAGLHRRGQSPWLIRYQVVLVYLGAGLNKLLDPDWRSGQFFETWTSPVPHHRLLRRYLPLRPLLVSRLMSWLVIVVELFLALGFSYKRLSPVALWTGVLYHTALLVDVGSTFNMFYFAMLSAYLAFVEWPSKAVTLEYAPSLGALARALALHHRLDPGYPLRLRPRPDARGTLAITVDSRRYRGWSAITALILFSPVSYLVYAVLLSLLQPGRAIRWVALATVTVFSPLFGVVANRLLGVLSRRGSSPRAHGRAKAL